MEISAPMQFLEFHWIGKIVFEIIEVQVISGWNDLIVNARPLIDYLSRGEFFQSKYSGTENGRLVITAPGAEAKILTEADEANIESDHRVAIEKERQLDDIHMAGLISDWTTILREDIAAHGR